MATLVIHAPDYRVKHGAESFETILEKGRGKGYIIFPKDVSRLPPGSKAVLLRNDKDKKRAEGILVKLDQTITTPKGKKRYNVHFKDAKVIPYSYKSEEKLNRCGVAVIEGDCQPVSTISTLVR